MTKYLRRIAEWGVAPETPYEQAHHFRLTNVVLLFLFFGSILQTLACFLVGAIDAALLNCTAPLVFGLGLWLMKSGHTLAARLMVVTLCYGATYAFAAALGPESYFQIMFLFGSALAFILFSLKEKWMLAYGLMTPLLLYVLLEFNHYEPILGMKRAEYTPGQLMLLRSISLSLIWAVMTGHFLYSAKDRKKTQEQLVSSAKMVAIGNIAAGIAHEINNPLQVIVSYSDRLKLLVKAESSAPETLTQACEKIQAVALRIGTITRGLLSLSRDSSGDPFERVPVVSILRMSFDCSRAHLESNRVEVHVDEVPDDCFVLGRETQLTEVLLNLLNNAYSAVLESSESHKWIRVETSAIAQWIEIAVTDNGPGVSEKMIERIFEPFFTTKPLGHGTGLGLSISRTIMAAHGGDVYYVPQPRGARFVMRLPRAPLA